MVDFNATRSQLNISQEQFHALDKLDGKFDGNMAESIFNQAKEYRECQMRYSPLNEREKIDKEIRDILDRGITYWNAPKPGTEGAEMDESIVPLYEKDGVVDENGNFVELKIYDENDDEYGFNKCKNENFYKELEHATAEIAIYYSKHGKLDGCKALKTLPSEVEFVSYDFEYIYDDDHSSYAESAEFIGGMPVYKKNPVVAWAHLTFSYKGKKYTFSDNMGMAKPKFGIQ